MKKVISTIGMLVGLLFLLAAPAYAANINVETDPSPITTVGNVNLKFTVMNDSTYTMREMRIRGYNISDSDNSLGGRELYPGEGITFNTPNVPVTAQNIGSTIVYTFYWTENSVAQSREVAVKLGDGTSVPVGADMTGTCTLSKTGGRAGDKITLTYTLKNPGSAPMTDVTIKDTIAGSNAVKSGITIDANGSTTATYEFTLGSADAVSEPTITYTVNGESKTLKLEKQTIAIVNLKLSYDVTMADPTPEGVLFTIVLKNTGNQTITGISVKDDLGAAVNAEAITLQGGQESLLTHTVRAEGTRVVSFTITGKDESGQPYEDKTGSYNVLPYIDPSSISFQLFTHVLQNLDESGKIEIRFTIQNNSEVELTDASISEAQLGVVLQPLPVLPKGETVNELVLTVGEPRELVFTAIAKDPSGVEHKYEASFMANLVALATPTPAPEATPDAEQPVRGMNSTLITVLIVLAVLMAVAGIALLVLSVYERKRNAQMDDAMEAEEYVRNSRNGGAQPKDAPPPEAKAKVKRRDKKQKRNADAFDDEFDDEFDDDFGDTKPQNAVRKPPVAPPRPAQQPPVSQDHGRQPKPQSRQPKPADAPPAYRPTPMQQEPPRTEPFRPEPIDKMPPQPVMPQATVSPVQREPVPQFAEPPKFQPSAPMTFQVDAAEPATPEPIIPVAPAQWPLPSAEGPVKLSEEPPVGIPIQPVQPASAVQAPAQPMSPVQTPPAQPVSPVQVPPAAPPPQQAAPVEPVVPVQMPPAQPAAPQQPTQPQANAGVRNRIHRVRPVDRDPNE